VRVRSLREVALLEDVRVAEGRVVVEAHLGVGGDEGAGVVLGQRVDLDHRAVTLREEAVERLGLGLGLG